MTKHNADSGSGRADLSPHAHTVWLPAGAQHTVLIDATATPSFFTDGGPAVVEVGFDPAGDVVARIDGEVLGEFEGESSAQLSPSLRQLESRGLIALAHGSFATVDGAPALTVYADPLGVPRSLADSESPETAQPSTDPFPATEPFAADRDAEAAALAADASETSHPGGTTARGFQRRRNPQAVAILSSALAIGIVGMIGYYYGAGERDHMTAFINSTSETTASDSSTATSASSSTRTHTSTTSATESATASSAPFELSQSQDPGHSPSEAASGGAPDQAPAPGPAPAAPKQPPANNAPAPAAPGPAHQPPTHHNTAQAPAPAPAPAPADDDGSAYDVPPPQPIIELQW